MNLLYTAVFVSWMTAFGWGLMMLFGYLFTKQTTKYKNSKPYIIFQVTTIGNDTINQIIAKIKSYNLDFLHEYWVVTEPSDNRAYSEADRVVIVPADFRVRAKAKSRALEYARLLRQRLALPSNYLVLYMDDDSVPSREFIAECYTREFDLLEGVISSSNNKGSVFSYLDQLRIQACLTICATFQSISHPIWIHGESMCITRAVDEKVSWDKNIVASEDLVYGHSAISQGFKLRFTYAKIFITSPLDVGDFLKQRRRWIWGNIYAVIHLLNWKSAMRLSFFWIYGLTTFTISTVGAALNLLHVIVFPLWVQGLTAIGLLSWFLVWSVVGWNLGRTFKSMVMTTMFSFPATVWNNVLFIYSLTRGPIKRFDVIKKQVLFDDYDA